MDRVKELTSTEALILDLSHQTGQGWEHLSVDRQSQLELCDGK